jgi:hypothetical protein
LQDTHRYNTGALLTPFYHLALRSKSLQPHFCGVTHETANSRHVTVPGDPEQIPFAIPFDVWVSTFLHFIMNDKASKGRPTCSVLPEGTDEDHRSVTQDGFDKLADADVKMLIKISFIEAAIGAEEGPSQTHRRFCYLGSLCRGIQVPRLLRGEENHGTRSAHYVTLGQGYDERWAGAAVIPIREADSDEADWANEDDQEDLLRCFSII